MKFSIKFVFIFFCFEHLINQGNPRQTEHSHLNNSGEEIFYERDLNLTDRHTSLSWKEGNGVFSTSAFVTKSETTTGENVSNREMEKGPSTQYDWQTTNIQPTSRSYSSESDRSMTQRTSSYTQTESSTENNWRLAVTDEFSKLFFLHEKSTGALTTWSTSLQTTESKSNFQGMSETKTMKPRTLSTEVTPSTGSVIEDECLEDTQCKPSNMDHWYCGCDELCLDYNDCCYPSNVTVRTGQNSQYACTRLVWGSSISEDPSKFFGLYTISNCIVGNRSLIEKCKSDDILETGPPVGSNQDKRRIYKNKHCAFCNNEKDFTSFNVIVKIPEKSKDEITLASIQRNFSSNQELMESFVEAGFEYEFVPRKEAKIRRCIPILVENDNPLCKLYASPVFKMYRKGPIYYRNVFCSYPEDGESMSQTCLARYYTRLVSRSDYLRKLSVMFAFTEEESAVDVQETSTCDSWTQEIADQGLCSHKISIANAIIQIAYFARIMENLTEYDLRKMVILTLWAKSLPRKEYDEGSITIERFENVLKISSQPTFFKTSFLDEISRIEENFCRKVVNIVVRENNIYRTIFTTEENSAQPYHDFVHVQSGQFNLEFDLDSIYKIKIPQDVSTINEFCMELTVALISQQDDHYQVESITCNEPLENLQSFSSQSLAILTYICCGVSIVSLGILITYNRKNSLHVDIPSSNLENMAVSILAANLFFLCGIGAIKLQKLCYAISIVLHYFWLASFSFTSLAVVYIVSTLLKMRARQTVNSEDQSKQRKVITMLGMLIPILFVGPAVVIDQHGPEYLSPGYGQSACFPTQFPGNIIFFTGPVMASVSMNLVCLIPVIVKLQKSAMETRQIRQSSIYDQSKIYLRLIVLSGVFWVTGIFAAIFRSEWLDYVFTILCGLHGFFLAVANLTTSRIKRLRNRAKDTCPT